MSAARRSSSTAMAITSPIFTEDSRRSASGRERAHPLPTAAGRRGLIRSQALLARGRFPCRGCAATALLVLADFGLGQLAAPVLAAADERQRRERQQRRAH